MDVKHVITAYCCYLRIQMLSIARMWGALSMVAKALFAAVAVLVGYALSRMDVELGAENVGWITAVFVVVGMRVCRMERTEIALLEELGVRLPLILAGRCLVMAVPFFLLGAWVGVWVATVGTVVTTGSLTVMAAYRRRGWQAGGGWLMRRVRFGGPVAGAYMWIAGYRAGGTWATVAGGVLLAIALTYDNADMAGVAMAGMVCEPAVIACYRRQDPKDFLRIYRSANSLVKRKAMEGIVCSIIPLCCSFPIATAVFPDQLGWLAVVAGAAIYAAMIFIYALYAFYPHQLTSMVVAIVVIVGTIVWGAVVPAWVTGISAMVIMAGLHGLSVYNMKHLI